MHRDPRKPSPVRAHETLCAAFGVSPRAAFGAALGVALVVALGVSSACRPAAQGFGRVTLLESRLGPSSWSVLVEDRGQGVDLLVDGSPRQAQCRRIGQGIRCWVGGLRAGFHRLAVQVGGSGTTRRTALSPAPQPADLVIYEVVLDRFADGDPGNNVRVHKGELSAPQGGDLAGLRARLPFLKQLGVNAVLLSPIWEHTRTGLGPGGLPAWLGARPSSPAGALRLSPALGTAPELMRLLSAARRRGLRVLLDLPRPEGWPIGRYFEVVHSWLSRTMADGARLGPPRAGEEKDWAGQTRKLSEAFSPLLLVHRGGDGSAALGRALAPLPSGARIVEDRAWGERLVGSLGCQGVVAAPGAPWGASVGPVARLLSEARSPSLAARCQVAGDGTLAQERAEKRARLALTTHLMLAEIPVVFYADGVEDAGRGADLPALGWPGSGRTERHRLIQRLAGLRRAVTALRRGARRVRVFGDTLVVARHHRSCRALVVVHRGPSPRKLVLPLSELGWPAEEDTLELVERLSERGVAAPRGLLTLALEPWSVSVLVPAGQDACRG